MWAESLSSDYTGDLTSCYNNCVTSSEKNGRIRQLLLYHGKEDILRQRDGARPWKMSQTLCIYGKEDNTHDVVCNYILKGDFDLLSTWWGVYIWSGLRKYFRHSGYDLSSTVSFS